MINWNKILPDELWYRRPPLEGIEATLKESGIVFPNDYIDYMKWSDGGEGDLSEYLYVSLWEAKELFDPNVGYEPIKSLPMLFCFGDDGPHFYAFDRSDNMKVVRVPMGDTHPSMVEFVSDTFLEMLEEVKSGRVY